MSKITERVKHSRHGIQRYSLLTPAVLSLQLSGRLKGKPTPSRSSAFIDPMKNLSVSPGACSSGQGLCCLRSLVSPSPSLPFSPRIPLPLLSQTHLSFSLPRSLSAALSPQEQARKMSPDQISGSLQHCLSASVCLFHPVSASLTEVLWSFNRVQTLSSLGKGKVEVQVTFPHIFVELCA